MLKRCLSSLNVVKFQHNIILKLGGLMKIVILDGNALNPGDLSWEEFKKIGKTTIYDRTPPELVIERIGDAEILITNKVSISETIISQCKNLKYIGVLATGYNIIDVEAARKKSIVVTNIPAYSTNAVAQAVFAYILEFANGVHAHNQSVHNGDWCNSKDFCYWTHPLVEISGKTLGIIGYGSIGQQVAKIAAAFGMNVLAYSRTPSKIQTPAKSVSLEELLQVSDFISLHAPLTPETTHIINDKTLSLVKPSAMLINTARGPLVDEVAVNEALNSGKLSYFATDVLSSEPMAENCPLLKQSKAIITPHVAWAGLETRQRLMDIAVKNLQEFLKGNPVNQV